MHTKERNNDQMNNNQNSNKICKKVIHDIRNFKKFDNNILEEINNLNHEELMEIIKAYNNVMDNINDIIENFK